MLNLYGLSIDEMRLFFADVKTDIVRTCTDIIRTGTDKREFFMKWRIHFGFLGIFTKVLPTG